ncbi:MAG: nucleotidyltransferase family protein [Ignavibacteria bacterium]|nr:nucleotidyltransferase family protein [Ignavibacteria bacterium]
MSDISTIIEKLKSAKPSLSAKYNINNLAVFGSYSRNEQNAESDIDIMVEFSKPIGLEFVSLAFELEQLLGTKVDLVSKKAIKKGYLNYILKDIKYV